MQKFKKYLSMTAVVLLVASLVTAAMWFCVGDVFDRSMSSIGREYYSLFMPWAILLSATLLTSYTAVGMKVGVKVKRKWGAVFYAFVVVAAMAQLVSNLTLGTDPTSMAIHLWFSLIFGVTSLILLALLLLICCVKAESASRIFWIALGCFHVVVSLGFLGTILVFDFTAFYQILVVLFGWSMLLVLNLIPVKTPDDCVVCSD